MEPFWDLKICTYVDMEYLTPVSNILKAKYYSALSPTSTVGLTSRILLADVIMRINKASLALIIASCMLQYLPYRHDRSEVH